MERMGEMTNCINPNLPPLSLRILESYSKIRIKGANYSGLSFYLPQATKIPFF